jgi:putative heme iron utilization protein
MDLKERVRQAFEQHPSAMTPHLAAELGITECEVIRHMPADRSVELDIEKWEALIRDFESIGRVHVICNTGTVTLEANGEFGNFSTWGPYFNVQTKTLDMHIQFARLAAVFAVEKPSHMDKAPTLSFQFFDVEGKSAFKVFLNFGGGVSEERRKLFDTIRDRYRRTPVQS